MTQCMVTGWRPNLGLHFLYIHMNMLYMNMFFCIPLTTSSEPYTSPVHTYWHTHITHMYTLNASCTGLYYLVDKEGISPYMKHTWHHSAWASSMCCFGIWVEKHILIAWCILTTWLLCIGANFYSRNGRTHLIQLAQACIIYSWQMKGFPPTWKIHMASLRVGMHLQGLVLVFRWRNTLIVDANTHNHTSNDCFELVQISCGNGCNILAFHL